MIIETSCTVSAVSGQLKKPRVFAEDVVLTQTGMKGFMVEKGLLPKIEKPVKESDVEAEEMPTAEDAE